MQEFRKERDARKYPLNIKQEYYKAVTVVSRVTLSAMSMYEYAHITEQVQRGLMEEALKIENAILRTENIQDGTLTFTMRVLVPAQGIVQLPGVTV